ncbi:hypothetical protein FKM82_016682 [Ascaphus truei]
MGVESQEKGERETGFHLSLTLSCGLSPSHPLDGSGPGEILPNMPWGGETIINYQYALGEDQTPLFSMPSGKYQAHLLSMP